MKPFMDEEFLLSSHTAQKLYHEYAENLPIIDYHCHINPKEIAEDRIFENIGQMWLEGDHYKWRLIRANGAEEDSVTGKATDREKFQAFAEALPSAIGNPIYHWTHLELKRYFGYEGVLNGDTAEAVWKHCNEKIKSEKLSVRKIIADSNVEIICTTDDPVDSLEAHIRCREDSALKVKVFPSFRPDKAIQIDKADFCHYIKKLGQVCGSSIETWEDLLTALKRRMDFFHEQGCRVSDHGLKQLVYRPASEGTVAEIFRQALCGSGPTQEDGERYMTAVMQFLGREYAARGWVMQLHYGTVRNTNGVMFNKLGPDTGYDCISSKECGEALIKFLDSLFQPGCLPKTILYSLNPSDNQVLCTIAGCFQGPEAKGKIQHGSAWWFNDTKEGIKAQLISLASLSLLGNFVGMLTDSRSFLSYTRHEYFRRILCDYLGELVENGEYPQDWTQLKTLVENVAYSNAAEYFCFSC